MPLMDTFHLTRATQLYTYMDPNSPRYAHLEAWVVPLDGLRIAYVAPPTHSVAEPWRLLLGCELLVRYTEAVRGVPAMLQARLLSQQTCKALGIHGSRPGASGPGTPRS